MPELPEIYNRAKEMNAALPGKIISAVEVIQPKCLNMPVEGFAEGLVGAQILGVGYHGKWLQVELSQGWLLINLGMGGEILLTHRTRLPEKYRLVIDFSDETCLSLNFWWFGYAHYVGPGELDRHTLSARLGPNAIDLQPGDLHNLLQGQRGQIKAFLLDQSRLAGIGNAYVHDILFLAKLHPQRRINTLTPADIDRLAHAVQAGLQPSIDLGGAFYEQNLNGEKGGFTFEKVLIGYRDGQPCPVCQTPIEKIKTGSTSSFICPHCQPLVEA